MSATASTTRDLLGRALGDFVVNRQIGEGGFGAVYLAEQRGLAREAVIKVLHTRHQGTDAAVQRFLRESRLASRLDHPYAAHIYAFGAEADGLLWIAMELVRGTPLDKLLRIQGPLPLERLLPLLDRICEVVHSAHEQGIVHRDLKPANVMVLSRAGRLLPKLLDFGIAKALGDVPTAPSENVTPPLIGPVTPSRLASDTIPDRGSQGFDETLDAPARGDETVEATQETRSPSRVASDPTSLTMRSGGMVGSPSYMAPEQWANSTNVDARADLYALGVLVYECLTGRMPFTGTTLMEIAFAHAQAPMPPLGPGFPPAVESVLTKALAKKPADRYGTALEFAAALRAAAGLAAEPTPLPRLDPELRDRATANLPQPIAEAVAALEAARNPHQARDEVYQLVHVAAQYLGLLALACRSRIGPGTGDQRAVTDALRALRRNGLDDRGWLGLARELCRPFAQRREAYPIPELVAYFFSHGGDAPDGAFEALLDARASTGSSDQQLRASLGHWMPLVARLLTSIEFLTDYPLVVRRGDHGERWMGTRRAKRVAATILGARFPDGEPGIVDPDGVAVLALAPLVQAAAPAPGAPEELFLLDGPGRHGARLVARPSGFERHDDSLWEWFRKAVLDTQDTESPVAAEERSPYRGLSTFTPADAALFFGREGETATFVNRLRMMPLVAVVGASGAGKSSFVQAGVLPALPAEWRSLVVRPGVAPLAALAARLSAAGIKPAGDLGSDPDALGRALAASIAPGQTFVLVIDQFEELFTLCADATERAAYAAALARAARSSDDPVRVILTLRDDFLMRAQQLRPLSDRLAQGLQLLATPAADDLVRILVEPARRVGFEFEDPELPREMVRAVAEQPGALALLSFTAGKLWELRDRHFNRLPRKAYEAMGGVGGALAQHAESTLAQMSVDEQKLVRDAFRHLVTSEGTRAVLLRADLHRLLGGDTHAEAVIERLVGARLLVASESDAGVEQIEIVHEALLSAWPRLVAWRREDIEGTRLRDQLRAAARQWDQRGRARGLLWRDEALTEYQLWRARHPGPLGTVEEAFADASVAEAARVLRRRRRAVAGTIFVLVAGVLVLLKLNQRAIEQRRLATAAAAEASARLAGLHEEQGRQLLLAGDPVRALVYLTEAVREGRSGPGIQFMLGRAWGQLAAEQAVLRGHQDIVTAVDLRPDGEQVVTGSIDKTARIWDKAGRQLVTLQTTAGVWSVRYVGAGKQILTGSADGTIALWDAQTGAPLAQLAIPKAGGRLDAAAAAIAPRFAALRTTVILEGLRDTTSVASLFPDGIRWAAIRGKDVLVRDVSTGRTTTLTGHRGAIRHLALSGDGSRIATSSVDGTAKVWDARTGRQLASVQVPPDQTRVSLNGRGTRLLTAQWDRMLRAWDVSTGKMLMQYEGHTGAVTACNFSPDEHSLVSTARDGTARVWDARTGQLVTTLRGHLDAVWTATFGADGEHVATASWDHTGRVWTTRAEQTTLTREPTNFGLFNRDGSRLLAVGSDGLLAIWDVRGARLLRTLRTDGRTKDAAMWSADESRIVTCNGDAYKPGDTVDVWDGHAGAHLAALRTPGAAVSVADISGDGTRVVTAEAGGVSRVWDIAAGRVIAVARGHQGAINSAAFSPDGARFVTTGDDKTARIWDAKTGQQLVLMTGHSGQRVNNAWFSANGTHVVTAGDDKSARIWDAATGRQLARFDHPEFVWSARLSADEQLVVTVAGDGLTRVWDVASERLLTTFQHPGAVWAELSPDGRFGLTVGAGGLQLWRADRDLRPPTEISRAARCRIPFTLAGDRLLAATPDPSACAH